MSRLNFPGPANVAESSAPLAKHAFTTEGTGFSLTLKLRSFATDARASPLFISNFPISGKVRLDVSQPLKASSVVLTIRGFERGTLAEAYPSPSAFNSAHERNFVEHKVLLWSSSQSATKRLEAREHRFTFREILPATINSRDGQTVPLPPTFTGDNCPVFTLYEISVVIQRGFLQRDERVDAPIRIVTRSQPPPPSTPMRRAHELGTLLPGPHADGAGWLTKAVSIHLRTTRQHVELRCQCAVAAPASHSRGYPIPLWFTIHLPQPQALAATGDLLLRGGVLVQLTRSIRWHRDALPVAAAPDVVVAQARFWRIPSPDANKKMLQGEILPPATLPPSFTAPNFELQYTISFAFQPSLRDAGIHFDDEPVSLPVQITSNPSAVRPRSYAP